MWDPDGHTLSFRSSWWRLDVEVVVFFDGKKPDGNFGRISFGTPKNHSSQNRIPLTYPWDWYICLPTWKPWKSTIHVGIPYYGLYGIVSPPPKKKKSNWKVQPAQTRKKDLCWPFPKLPFGISTASILTKDLGPRRGVIFEHLGPNSLYWG